MAIEEQGAVANAGLLADGGGDFLGAGAVDLDLEPWWDKTRSMPVADAIANWLEDYAQPAAAELYEKAAEKVGS